MFVEYSAIKLLLPELVLILTATAIFVGGACMKHRSLWSLIGLAGFVLAGFLMSVPANGGSNPGPVAHDGLSESLRWICLLSGVFLTSLAWHSAARELLSEQIGLVMCAVAGAMISCAANDLILLFLGLELVSVPTYVLLFTARKDRAAAESAAKYFFLSIASSAILLYGLSFLYGLGGTTLIFGTNELAAVGEPIAMEGEIAPLDGRGIREALQSPDSNMTPLGAIAVVLIIAGFGFKLAAAPFHFYAPDVYEGANHSVAALLAVLPKLAAASAIARVVIATFTPQAEFAWQLLFILSALSMTIGNVCALWQKNLRRLLAYSSIAHGGYALIGLSVAQAGAAVSHETFGGVAGTTFYLAAYAFGAIGSFAALAALGERSREANSLDDIAGAGRTRPLAAAALAVFMFSLAGIPPLGGFWGKFTLFSSAVQFAGSDSGGGAIWFYGLAVIGALNAAIGAAYYLRVVGALYFQGASDAEEAPLRFDGALVAAISCAVLVIAVGLFPGSLFRGARAADDAIKTSLTESVRKARMQAAEIETQEVSAQLAER